MSEQLFIKATRDNVTISTQKGNLNPQQLWQLPVQSVSGVSLDGIFQSLSAHKERTSGRSLVSDKSVANELLDLQIELVRFIAETKMTENKESTEAKVKQSRKKELEDMLYTLELKQLASDPDAIRAELAKLGL